MVDLEKIKREVRDVCLSIERAFIALNDRAKVYEEEERQIGRLKSEIILLQERKANVAQSARDEQNATIKEKNKYTEEKIKYRKLNDEEKMAHAQILGKHQAEIDSMRVQGLSLLKSDQNKVVSETNIYKQERDEIKREYLEFKTKLANLKEGIPD